MEPFQEQSESQSLPEAAGGNISSIPINPPAAPDEMGRLGASPPAAHQSTAYLREGAPQVSMIRTALACAAGLVIPGLGHLLIGRWGRAVLLALAIGGMFAVGLFWMGGRLHQPEPGEPLSFFPFIANAGLGAIYALCYAWKVGFEANAAVPTYEFGNTLLFGSGLLNYLVVLDAFDIAVGRKD